MNKFWCDTSTCGLFVLSVPEGNTTQEVNNSCADDAELKTAPGGSEVFFSLLESVCTVSYQHWAVLGRTELVQLVQLETLQKNGPKVQKSPDQLRSTLTATAAVTQLNSIILL